MRPTAFVSHASADAVQATRLSGLLEQHGVQCWIAPRDLTPGQPYADEIVHGIEGCAAFVLLATTASLSSPNVLNELEQAHRSARALYTVMVNKPKLPSDASYYLARLHWLETDGADLEAVASRLSRVMSGAQRWEAVASPPSLARTFRNLLPAFGGAFAAIALTVVLLSAAGAYYLRIQQRHAATDYRSLGWTTLEAVKAGDSGGDVGKGRVWLGDANLLFSQTTLELVTVARAGRRQRYSPPLPASATGEAAFTFPLGTDLSEVDTLLAIPSAAERAEFCIAQRFTIANGVAQESGSPQVTQLRRATTCQ